MTRRIGATSRVLLLLGVGLLAGFQARGWEFGLPDGEAARPKAEIAPAPAPADPAKVEIDSAAGTATVGPVVIRNAEGGEPAAGPVDVPMDPVIRPRPDRALPDTVGVLLERRAERRVAGVDVDDYLLYLPPGLENEDGEWPLLLWLHGRSLRGDDLGRLKRYGPPALVTRGSAIPFIMVAPQLPPDGRWADLDPVAAIVDEVAAKYPVDRDRIYLMGFSMGGGGAYRMAFAHGSKFAAMIGLAGHTPAATEQNVGAVARLPFLAIHGENDVRVPLPPARRMAAALAAVRAPLFEFRMAPGMNHSQLERLTRDESLYSWLLSHRRARPVAPPPAAVRR